MDRDEDDDGGIIANRDDAIPVLRIPSRTTDNEQAASDSSNDKREGLRDRIRNKLNDAAAPSIQDRLFTSLMAQIIPPEELSKNEGNASQATSGKKDRRSRTYVDRPNFSVGMMSGNFRRFNSRVGIIFVFQNRLIHLFTWRHPPATLSFLTVYTLICLDPYLLPIIPIALVLFFVMLPSFLARHPAPNSTQTQFGPPLAPASRVKPAPELSKDFFRNLRDLQNSMEDFSRLHDAANEYITPYTNFSDEATSSALFLALFVIAIVAFIASNLMPWRLISLTVGWLSIAALHPTIQSFLLSPESVGQVHHYASGTQSWLTSFITSEILLDAPAEVREVEIFELQKHHPSSETWEPWLFCPTPFEPLSPQRLGGGKAKGTQFFEDVAAPVGWRWKGKKWGLDMGSREWVEERMITGVEVETEGERWVYDLPGAEHGAEGSGKKKREVPKSGWEEGNGDAKRGLWRRRRWVRSVERVGRKPKEQRLKISALSTLDPGMLNPGAVEPVAIT
ncbi:hypothetical protein B0A48_08510 [Cryoendolithus antarcticus]|uniref:TECPR1-like DysF domain-containing protein n=1 Tax=Cryoendolithus antarcticus TaxID=1507870 RepID=A0A1V8T5N3_9PEZI|nr:hypothetical protein B0A48_08510 [Cryoendolithus antarcticus]